MAVASPAQVLGQVTCPSGTLAILDCGLLAAWRHPEHSALARAGGQFQFGGAQAVAQVGLPMGPFTVSAARSPGGDTWRWVDLEFGLVATAVSVTRLGQVGVDQARLMFTDVAALSHWAHDQPQDGRADVAFWGRDAEALAAEVKAGTLSDGVFGWEGMSPADARQWVQWLEGQKTARTLQLAVDYRPHDHHYAAMALVRSSPIGVGLVQLGGARVLVMSTRQGDGLFDVLALTDSAGLMVALRIDLSADGGAQQLQTASVPEMPPDPITSTQRAAKSAVEDMAQSAAKRAAWTKVKQVLPRWAWPLLPDGKRGLRERALTLGKDKLIGMAVGCLFSGCLMLVIGVGLLSLFGWIAWTVVSTM